jgi:hypothetical protein
MFVNEASRGAFTIDGKIIVGKGYAKLPAQRVRCPSVILARSCY